MILWIDLDPHLGSLMGGSSIEGVEGLVAEDDPLRDRGLEVIGLGVAGSTFIGVPSFTGIVTVEGNLENLASSPREVLFLALKMGPNLGSSKAAFQLLP